MRRSVQTVLAIAALLAGLIPGSVDGRVFRTGGNPKGRLNAVGLPWRQAYQTTMQIDGRRTDVVVYSARETEPVALQLKAQFELQGATVKLGYDASGGAMGTARWTGGEARILIMKAGSEPKKLVYLFYPEADESAAPESPVPEYPRGTITHVVGNMESGSSCTTATTLDSAEQVHRHYQEVMAREGWSPLLPLTSGMACFHKGEKTCCILTGHRESGETTVTLLVRDAGI